MIRPHGRLDLGPLDLTLDRAKRAVPKACPITNFKGQIPQVKPAAPRVAHARLAARHQPKPAARDHPPSPTAKSRQPKLDNKGLPAQAPQQRAPKSRSREPPAPNPTRSGSPALTTAVAGRVRRTPNRQFTPLADHPTGSSPHRPSTPPTTSPRSTKPNREHPSQDTPPPPSATSPPSPVRAPSPPRLGLSLFPAYTAQVASARASITFGVIDAAALMPRVSVFFRAPRCSPPQAAAPA